MANTLLHTRAIQICGKHLMSINVELALVMGLFIIGAVVLAVDNLVDALYKCLTRWKGNRRSSPANAQHLRSTQRKRQ